MSKYTPGPWTAYECPNPGRASAAFYILGKGDDRRASAVAHVKNSTLSPIYANARLIAAAPDLLEALQMVRFDVLDSRQQDFINYAIAKATGEA